MNYLAQSPLCEEGGAKSGAACARRGGVLSGMVYRAKTVKVRYSPQYLRKQPSASTLDFL